WEAKSKTKKIMRAASPMQSPTAISLAPHRISTITEEGNAPPISTMGKAMMEKAEARTTLAVKGMLLCEKTGATRKRPKTRIISISQSKTSSIPYMSARAIGVLDPYISNALVDLYSEDHQSAHEPR